MKCRNLITVISDKWQNTWSFPITVFILKEEVKFLSNSTPKSLLELTCLKIPPLFIGTGKIVVFLLQIPAAARGPCVGERRLRALGAGRRLV